MANYYLRVIDLPLRIEGVTIPNYDGTFNIYINSRLSRERQREIAAHEIEHIRRGHFNNDNVTPVDQMEVEADAAIPQMYRDLEKHNRALEAFYGRQLYSAV